MLLEKIQAFVLDTLQVLATVFVFLLFVGLLAVAVMYVLDVTQTQHAVRRNYPVAIATRSGAQAEEEVTITGCLCTPLDLLADEVTLPRAEVGDLVAIFCAGAYGLTASPAAFLSQPAAREMLV